MAEETFTYEPQSFDPYSIFKVNPEPCHVVKVKVVCGRHITKGKVADALDTPDPYVKVHIPTSKCPSQKTVHKDNTHNPEWDEEFKFVVDPEVKNILKVELWEANPVLDEELDKKDYDLDLLTLGEPTKVIIKFKLGSEVYLELHRFKSETSDLRHGLTLCDEEKQFLKQRKEKVYATMRDVLGEESPETQAEVPVIGVLASGGGLRATVGFSGVVSALHKLGILDMVTYISCLSGSSWYIGQLYSNPDWPNKDPGGLQDQLKQKIISLKTMKTALSPSFISKFMDDVNQKKKRRQPISLPDYVGHLIGTTLLKDQMDTCLSHQREKVCDGSVPLPLYTAIRVKPKEPATQYHEWMEYSPYEISLQTHGISLAPELLNSKFYLGHVIERFPETKLQYLLAMFGSAYAIMLSRLANNGMNQGNKHSLTQTDSNGSNFEDADDSEGSNDEQDHEDTVNRTGNDKSQKSAKTNDELAPGRLLAFMGMSYLSTLNGEQKTSEKDTSNNSAPSSPTSGENSPKLGKFQLGQRMRNSILRSNALTSRKRRAARVHNFLFGLKLPAPFALFPFSPTAKVSEKDADLTDSRTLYMVDAGLSVNLPIPPLVKPQRHVDLMISFDFSLRDADKAFPFQDLLETEEWARQHGVPFPPITVTKESVSKEGIKECYVFRDAKNDLCPIVVHFVLINDSFRRFKSPGVPRETEEEKAFADFRIFDDKKGHYATFSTSYSEKSFDRLSKLMAYNTLNHAEVIHEAITDCVKRRRQKRKSGGMLWDVARLTTMGAVRFAHLKKSANICKEGLEKVEILMGKKGNVSFRRYKPSQTEGMLEHVTISNGEEILTEVISGSEGDDILSVKEEEGENQGIGGKCSSGDEDYHHNLEEEVKKVSQTMTASQDQSSDRNDTAELQEKANASSNDPAMNKGSSVNEGFSHDPEEKVERVIQTTTASQEQSSDRDDTADLQENASASSNDPAMNQGGSVNEGFSHDPDEKVERVIQMRTASQGQISDRNDTAELREKASASSNDPAMNQGGSVNEGFSYDPDEKVERVIQMRTASQGQISDRNDTAELREKASASSNDPAMNQGGSVNEGFSYDPDEKVERVIQMRTASQGQSSYRNDTAELQENASASSNDLVKNQRFSGEVEQETSENTGTGGAHKLMITKPPTCMYCCDVCCTVL